ncbi:hypothetical protein D3C86_1397890 [compost metagenome]
MIFCVRSTRFIFESAYALAFASAAFHVAFSASLTNLLLALSTIFAALVIKSLAKPSAGIAFAEISVMFALVTIFVALLVTVNNGNA